VFGIPPRVEDTTSFGPLLAAGVVPDDGTLRVIDLVFSRAIAPAGGPSITRWFVSHRARRHEIHANFFLCVCSSISFLFLGCCLVRGCWLDQYNKPKREPTISFLFLLRFLDGCLFVHFSFRDDEPPSRFERHFCFIGLYKEYIKF